MRDDNEEKAILDALRNGDWGGYPLPNVCSKAFAEKFAKMHDCEFGLCVMNGTVSLEIALQAMRVEPGAEVIIPAYTFEGTASAALFAGCVPVFVDVDPETYCIDPKAIEAAITPKTQAIIPVHLAMRFADMDAINAIARKHGLRVLEDCAHAHGGKWNGKGAGSLGDAGSFSFQSSKLMTAGEGGIVIGNDPKILDGLVVLTNCGRQRPDRAHEFVSIGHNYRMTDLQAAILNVQLTRLESQLEHKNGNMAVLDQELPKIPGLSTLRRDPRITRQAAYQYVFKYDPAGFGGLPRGAFIAALNAEGVPCDGQFYEAVYNSSIFHMDAKRYPAWAARGCDFDCPVSMRAAYEESVWLSHHLFLGPREDATQIVEAIRKVATEHKSLIGFEHPSIERQSMSRAKRAQLETARYVG